VFKIKLDEPCSRCDGGSGMWWDGEIADYRTDSKCPDCGGDGELLTDEGRELIEVLAKWAKRMKKQTGGTI
jgi:DnaJ-class molecular chaperone